MKSIITISAALLCSAQAINLVERPLTSYMDPALAIADDASQKLAQEMVDEDEEAGIKTFGEDDYEMEDNDYIQMRSTRVLGLDIENDHTMC